MSARNLDFLCDLMAATLARHHDTPPFVDHKDLHNVIDATQLGNVPWQCFSAQYSGERPEVVPPWMDDKFEVWFRDPHAMAHNILANPAYKDEIDYVLFREYDASDNTRRWKDSMSRDWAWQQVVCLPYCLVLLGISLIFHQGRHIRSSRNTWIFFSPNYSR